MKIAAAIMMFLLLLSFLGGGGALLAAPTCQQDCTTECAPCFDQTAAIMCENNLGCMTTINGTPALAQSGVAEYRTKNVFPIERSQTLVQFLQIQLLRPPIS